MKQDTCHSVALAFRAAFAVHYIRESRHPPVNPHQKWKLTHGYTDSSNKTKQRPKHNTDVRPIGPLPDSPDGTGRRSDRRNKSEATRPRLDISDGAMYSIDEGREKAKLRSPSPIASRYCMTTSTAFFCTEKCCRFHLAANWK